MLTQYTTRAIGVVVITACLAIGGASIVPLVRAQGGQIDLDGKSMQNTLQAQVGKRVRLKLASGQDIEGQVVRVGADGVALTQLTGMEFYDATVRLEQIAAVIVRRTQ